MSAWPLFEFEQDFVDDLRCIPMAVRFKLDLAGIKLSLRQWSRFSLEDRGELLAANCHSLAEIDELRRRLIDLIQLRNGGSVVVLAIDSDPDWRKTEAAPAAVTAQAADLGLGSPSDADWASLTDLQRFVLIKLSRQGHDNVNFAPALREFRLLRANA